MSSVSPPMTKHRGQPVANLGSEVNCDLGCRAHWAQNVLKYSPRPNDFVMPRGIISLAGNAVAYGITALLGLTAVPSWTILRNLTRRQHRIRIGLLVLLVAAGSIFLVPPIRRPILRAAGWALVANDPLEPVDFIVVALDHDGAGVLEAADLVHSGVAARVAVFADPPDAVDREFIRRGLPYEDGGERDLQQLGALGIKNVEEIPKQMAGDKDEGPALADWCDKRRVRSILVVTHSDRSRRLRRLLHRAMRGHPTKIMIRSTRYSDFDPDRWWQTHGGIRTEIEEFERLLLDIARHPIS